MRLNLGALSGLRSAIADAIRPRAAVGSASLVQGWEALAYGSIYPSATGIEVNPNSALRCAPVYAAVKVISESFAQVPLFMHAKDEKGSLGRVLKHPLAELLHDMPNPSQTMFEMRQQMVKWLLTWGNAYAWIVRDYRDQVAELWPIRPEWVAVTFDPKFPLRALYTITAPNNTSHQLWRGDILHLKTFGVQNYKGDSPVLLNRETIAGWLVMEQHLSHLFGNGAKPSGVLEAQRAVTPEAVKLLRSQFDSTFGGYANSSKTIVLEEGMKWQPTSMTSVDSQFQELRKAQLYEVCRIFRIPPLLMQDAEKSGMGSTAETLAAFS